MKKFIFFLFFLSIGIVLFGWIIDSVGWEKIQLSFSYFSVWEGLVILLLTILSVLTRSVRWKTILSSQQCKVPFLRVFEYYLSGLSIVFFFPIVIFGGEIFRGYDLKKKYFIPWHKSIASVIIDKILEITVYIIAAIFGLSFFFLRATHISQRFFVTIFLGIFLSSILISILYFKIFRKESIILSLLKRFNLRNANGAETIIEVEKEIFTYFGQSKKVILPGLALSFLHELLLIIRTALLILFLGKKTGILLAVSVVSFSSLAMIIPIPAALGSHEAIQSFVFNSFGLGADTALAFVFIIRGVEFVVALFGAVFFFKFGMQMLESFVARKIKSFIDSGKKR